MSRESASSPQATTHVRAVVPLFMFSVLGILSSALFQLLVIRGLGAVGFGLLAAYLALINVASIGSSAVRNSVAVGVARIDLQQANRRDRTLWESTIYGALFLLVVLAMLTTDAYQSWGAGLWVALAVVPYFVFARAQGLMQGSGQATRVLAWSTGAQIAQLGFALLALALGADWIGVLFTTMLVAVIGAVLSTIQVRRSRLISTVKPFSPITVRALLITVCFTWLISMDVTWVQRFGNSVEAGDYSATATLIKVAFLVPTTLALYLLPKFAQNLKDQRFQLRGILWSGVASAVSSGFLFVGLWLLPGVLPWLFGPSYERAGQIAPWIALAFLPWVIAQTIITQMTARGALGPVILLITAGAAQYLLAMAILPNLNGWILAQGLLGAGVLIILLGLFAARTRLTRT